jgi:2'-5' RNA ligase
MWQTKGDRKMKATIVLIASNEVENYGRKMMLEAHKTGMLGFEMARLPQHVSLKQPFLIPNLEKFEGFFNEFAKSVKPIEIEFEKLNLFPSNVFGYETGCLSIEVNPSSELKQMQKQLFEKLEREFGTCPAEHDNDYMFHMTIAIGGASYQNYEKAYEVMVKKDYNCKCIFNKLGLLYYDDDAIKPGSYFCYKVLDI